jgi:hypothetical protein
VSRQPATTEKSGAAGEELPPVVTLEDDVCIHVFRASANMLGVCLTVIGLLRVLKEPGYLGVLGTTLLVTDATAFLVSCILSYIALRTRGKRRRYRIERTADVVFLSALSVMLLVCGLVAWEFI